jgi:hypothetical protein
MCRLFGMSAAPRAVQATFCGWIARNLPVFGVVIATAARPET